MRPVGPLMVYGSLSSRSGYACCATARTRKPEIQQQTPAERAGERTRLPRAGGRGFDRPPDRLLTAGPYALSRNPVYLGHLIFMLGLALSTGSKLTWAILLVNLPWFQGRVLYDEQRLREQFGAEYEAYCRRVRRWL